MGLEIHGLNLLRYAGNLGDLVTLGRCSNLLTARQLAAAGIPRHFAADKFADALLLHLGSRSVESYDNSDFEGAAHVADFNKPLQGHANYDTVVDFGTLEHIYNLPQAFDNVMALCRTGGQILHVSPGNNYCGHGFWQVSPELFFSLYSEANGFSQTEVFVAKVSHDKHWFRVTRPVNGQRAQVSSSTPLFVLCRTLKARTLDGRIVQQSDYVSRWAGANVKYDGLMGRMKDLIRERPSLVRLTFPIYHRLIANASSRNPHLTKLSVRDLVSSAVKDRAVATPLDCQPVSLAKP